MFTMALTRPLDWTIALKFGSDKCLTENTACKADGSGAPLCNSLYTEYNSNIKNWDTASTLKLFKALGTTKYDAESTLNKANVPYKAYYECMIKNISNGFQIMVSVVLMIVSIFTL